IPLRYRLHEGRQAAGSQADSLVPDPLAGNGVIRRTIKLIGHAHGIEHAPEHIQLELKNVQHALLSFIGRVMLKGDTQTMLDIPPRLLEAFAKVVISGCIDPDRKSVV